MAQTSASLLDRLHDPRSPEWERMLSVYAPLIRNWLRRFATPSPTTPKMVQEVLAVVVRRMPEFSHNGRTGAFRAWLRTITVNVLRDFWKKRQNHPKAIGGSDFLGALGELADPHSGLSQWDREHDLRVTRQLLELLRPSFEETTWRAFEQTAILGQPAAETAHKLGISVNAVFIAKSRVFSDQQSRRPGRCFSGRRLKGFTKRLHIIHSPASPACSSPAKVRTVF